MRMLLLVLVSSTLVTAESEATRIAAQVLRLGAERLQHAGEKALADQAQRLAVGVAEGRVSIDEARAIFAMIAVVPTQASLSVPAVPTDQVEAVLDGRVVAPQPPPRVSPEPDAVVAPQPPPIVASAHAKPPGPEGEVLAVQAGADGKPALVAISLGQVNGIREGQRCAITRNGATVVLARVNQVKDDMSIALLIPGTWVNAESEIAAGDGVKME